MRHNLTAVPPHTVVAPGYTALGTNIIIMKKTQTIRRSVLSGGGSVHSVRHSPGGESRLGTRTAGWSTQKAPAGSSQFGCQHLTDYRGKNRPFYTGPLPYYACAWPQRCGHPRSVVPGDGIAHGRHRKHRP